MGLQVKIECKPWLLLSQVTYIWTKVLLFFNLCKPLVFGFVLWWVSGDTDGRVPVLATRYSLSALELPIKTAWRPWYHEKQVHINLANRLLKVLIWVRLNRLISWWCYLYTYATGQWVASRIRRSNVRYVQRSWTCGALLQTKQLSRLFLGLSQRNSSTAFALKKELENMIL